MVRVSTSVRGTPPSEMTARSKAHQSGNGEWHRLERVNETLTVFLAEAVRFQFRVISFNISERFSTFLSAQGQQVHSSGLCSCWLLLRQYFLLECRKIELGEEVYGCSHIALLQQLIDLSCAVQYERPRSPKWVKRSLPF